MKRIALTICLLVCSVATADLVLVLKGTPTITVSSASINTAGDELTVNFSDSVTETDATGWSVEFDNYAERTLTYSSGSGTSAIVFSIAANSTYTDEDCGNDAAPVGTVCTLDYDSETGSISGLGDVTDQAVTNNSTAHPDPDLPEQVDTSLPANWNGTADYTPADASALQELLNGDGNGDAANGTANDWTIIELTSDGTNYGPLTIDDTVEYVLIRTDDYASLPAYGSRLLATDDGNGYLALISREPSQTGHYALVVNKGTGEAGASNVRFIGIKVAFTGSFGTNLTGQTMIGMGAGGDLVEQPVGIGFDRCLFTTVDAVKVRDIVRMDAKQSFVIGSRFENYFGAGNDGCTGIRTYQGGLLKYHNNYFEVDSAPVFLGDNFDTWASDVTITNNYSTRDLGWSSDGNQKAALLETKTGRRVLVKNNCCDNAVNMEANFAAVTIKADGSGGPKDTTHLTVAYNKIHNCAGIGLSYHVSGSSPGETVGPNFDALFEHNLVYDVDGRSAYIFFGAGLERVSFIHNTLIPNTDTQYYHHFNCFSTASNAASYHAFKDNICGGYATSLNGTLDGNGARAFNSAWDDTYEATHNIFWGQSTGTYDTDTDPTPLGTLSDNYFPSFGSIGFEDEASDDYRILSGTYATASSTGGPVGCDVETLNTIMSGVEE